MQDEFPTVSAPDVSVIMPAYNAGDYIRGALQSVQAQTVSSVEVIVVDDASTDDTGAIVLGLAAQDKNIRYVRMAKNAGPSASRNRGISLARGNWIALLDADDRFHPRRLEVLLSLGECHHVDVVSDNVLLCTDEDPAGRRMISHEKLPAPQLLSFPEFIQGCYWDANTPKRTSFVFMHPMFKRNFLASHNIAYDESVRNGEDFLFYLNCFVNRAKWYVTPEPMYIYTVRGGSLTECASRDDQSLQVMKLKQIMRDARTARDHSLFHAVNRHWKQVASDLYYWSFKDAFSARDSLGVFRVLTLDKAAPFLIVRQFITQKSQMFRKRL